MHPLYMAARFGHASATKQLLAARINIDLAECNGFTPIFVATQYGHVSVIDQLLVAPCPLPDPLSGIVPSYLFLVMGPLKKYGASQL